MPDARRRMPRRVWAAASPSARCLHDTVAHMPCNPAIGGTAKGHLVAEIDALGGLMGRAIDATGIQFKVLNRSRGPAVWSPRAQADKQRYGRWMRDGAPAGTEHRMDFREGRTDSRRARPCRRSRARRRSALSLRRAGDDDRDVSERPRARGPRAAPRRPRERAAVARARGVAEVLWFHVGPLEDGHSPAPRSPLDRFRSRAVSDGRFALEPGDDPPVPFSFLTESIEIRQTPCYLAHTNERVREIVTANIDKSPLFNGQIHGIGPRYCPSLEDKIVRFPERERHQIYLEPEGRRCGRDLRQRVLDEPAGGCPARDRPRDAGPRSTRACCGRRTRSSTTSFSRPS